MRISNTVAPTRAGAIGFAAAVRLAAAGLFAFCMLFGMAESPRAQDSSDDGVDSGPPDAVEKPKHDYTVSLRGAAWINWIDGEVKDTSSSRSVGFDKVKLDDDLGFDDPTVQFLGAANVRLGRHDFWVRGFSYKESETELVDRELDFGDITVGPNEQVVTDLDLVDINFSYGYSLFTIEQDGFRLGPTVAVSYTSVDLQLTEVDTGESEDIDEVFPVPTLGLQGEIPIGDVLLDAHVGGFYFDAGSFEGWGLRGGANAVWRPLDYLGVFVGFNMILADISLDDEDIDAALFGPVAGLELRF